MFNNIQEIDSSELAGWVADESHQLRVIDVREMPEIAQGILPKAEPLPLATLPAARPGDFEPDEKPVIICRSGTRSAQGCLFFQQQGFGNFSIPDGMRFPIMEHARHTLAIDGV